jgi:ubiquinone/menaquinone biosynthesis C-methylase UbiE
MTAPNVVQLVAVEEARIQRAYAHRRKQGRDRTSSWSRPAYAYDMQDRERKVLATLQRLGVRLAETRVLEVGCGTGAWIRDFVRWGAAPENIRAIDLLPECVVEARQRCAPGVHLQCCSATSLPFADSSFDLVLQATMFSSILEPAVRRVIAAEMLRVAGSNGVILWYDLSVNNPWNANVRGIGRAEVQELFPGCRIELQQISLAPPLARWIAPWSHQLWVLLASVPWLCTHYLCVIHPWRST